MRLKRAGVIGVAALSLLSSGRAAQAAVNTVTISDTSGSGQSNRPISISRVFVQGEILGFVQASINGTPVLTQTDVKNRWPDGSLKFAVVSFVIPNLAPSGSVTVAFTSQAGGNNMGFLAQTDMLDPSYNFDAQIQMGGGQTVSARQMIQSGAFRYWLQGPVVTAVIIEDRTTARSYDQDTGDGSKALHPIFEAWFYPASHKVQVGYSMENDWASSTLSKSMKEETYSFNLTAGNSSPVTVFSQPSFLHIGRSRWHKTFWVNGTPATVHIDQNAAYWISTRAIPNYDFSLTLSPGLISAQSGSAATSPTALVDGTSSGIGDYSKQLDQTGASDWIGLMPLWDTVYWLSMNDSVLSKTIGNADLSGRVPYHYREADSSAGSGHFFDSAKTVDTFGRVVSVNARPTVSVSQPWEPGCTAGGPDNYNIGTSNRDNWDNDNSHWPAFSYVPYLLTGAYYYLEELQMDAAFVSAWGAPCAGGGHFTSFGIVDGEQLRGEAWAFRTLAYAAFISPDGSPEKTYFEDKLQNNIIIKEGSHNIPNTDPSRQAVWTAGQTDDMDSKGPSPLHFWRDGGVGFIEGGLKTDGSLAGAASPWEENFQIAAWGLARDFGYTSTNAVLQWISNRNFHVVLDKVNVNNIYLLEAYRYPTKLTSTNNWIQNYAQYLAGYASLPTAWTGCYPNATPDHRYGFIAVTALAYLYPYSADGFNGSDAWNTGRTNEPCLSDFANYRPKWDILPRTGVIAPPPPPSLCDVNGDGQVNVADVQKEVNMDLQIIPCTNPSGTCNVSSVQKVVNAALGGTCVSP